MEAKVPTVTFNNGEVCPVLGLGTWKSKPGEVEQAVKDAIDIGYRHFDCAHVYQNEKEVGAAVKEKLDAGVVKREDLFITSKLWNTFHRGDLVVPALRQTLSDLKLDYLNLYLIHWPLGYKEDNGLFPTENDKTLYSTTDFTETWKSMEECVKLGLTKSIGLSNFNSEQIDKILSIATIKPVNNQVECHPYLNQEKLLKFCKERNITLTAYSPLGSPDRPWATANDVRLLDEPCLKPIADKHSKTPAQVLIRYQIERGIIVIPKSVTKSRIAANFDVLNFSLDDADMKALDKLNRNERYLLLNWVSDHKDYPFNIEF